MKTYIRNALLIALLLAPNCVLAESNSAFNAASGVVIIEGLFAVNSGLAILEPRVYGSIGLVLLPLGVAESRSNLATTLTTASLYAGICLYNILVPHQRNYANSEIFIHNMIGWHILALGGMTAGWLTECSKKQGQVQPVTVGMALGKSGPLLVVQFRY